MNYSDGWFLKFIKIAAFRSSGVSDSISFEFARRPTLSGLKLGMSSISLEVKVSAWAWLPAIKTSMFITESLLFK